MTDTRCPEPKPVTIFLLMVAGTAGVGLAGLWLSGSDPLIPAGKLFGYLGWMGAGLGTAIGVALGVDRRLWVRAMISPILGAVALTASLKIPYLFHEPTMLTMCLTRAT